MYYIPNPSGVQYPAEFVEFVYLASYARLAKGVVADEVERAFELAVVANPTAGDVVSGTGGVRKIRVAVAGGGKRGGARFYYVYRSALGRVYVLAVHIKNVMPSFSMAEKHELKRLVANLERTE